MITLTDITIENDKVTLSLEDFFKLIKQNKLTEVEYKVEPKPMAFDTKQELDDYVKSNPNATCKGISTQALLRFLERNIGKYFFLKEANLCDAKLYDVDLRYTYLCDADLRDADFRDARLSGNGVGADLRGAKYNNNTKFPEGFTIKKTMTKI